MTEKLLQCPFCGEEAYFERHGTNRQSCIVACESCGCNMETGETGHNCGGMWNSRAAQPAAYKDSTPDLRVGDSSFEAWFSGYNPAGNGDKQRAREAYAAGRDAGLSVAVEIICEAQEEARQEHMYPGLVATLDECARDVSALKSDAKEPA